MTDRFKITKISSLQIYGADKAHTAEYNGLFKSIDITDFVLGFLQEELERFERLKLSENPIVKADNIENSKEVKTDQDFTQFSKVTEIRDAEAGIEDQIKEDILPKNSNQVNDFSENSEVILIKESESGSTDQILDTVETGSVSPEPKYENPLGNVENIDNKIQEEDNQDFGKEYEFNDVLNINGVSSDQNYENIFVNTENAGSTQENSGEDFSENSKFRGSLETDTTDQANEIPIVNPDNVELSIQVETFTEAFGVADTVNNDLVSSDQIYINPKVNTENPDSTKQEDSAENSELKFNLPEISNADSPDITYEIDGTEKFERTVEDFTIKFEVKAAVNNEVISSEQIYENPIANSEIIERITQEDLAEDSKLEFVLLNTLDSGVVLPDQTSEILVNTDIVSSDQIYDIPTVNTENVDGSTQDD